MSAEQGNWVVRRRGPEGVLTNVQVRTLSKDFSISEEHVRALSKAIAYPLSPDFFVGSLVKFLKQQDKSSAELDILIKYIRQAEVRLAKAAAQIDQISIQFPNAGKGVEDPNVWLRHELHDSLKKVELIRHAVDRSTKKYSADFIGDPDKRRHRDERQWSILFATFDAWQASGRKETYTSDGITSKRSGPLVNFTNAVVSFVTEPVMEIKGETVRQALEKWQHFRVLEKQVDHFKKND